MLKDKYVGAWTLKERGWTETTIRKFLGEPDKTTVNPHYRSGPMCRLYLEDRVLAIESTPEWQEAKARSDKRKISSAKATATKTEKLLSEYIPRLQVDQALSKLPLENIQEYAIESYNEWNWGNGRRADKCSDKDFLERITKNFIRHELTNYDELLEDVQGKTGKNKFYDIIRSKISDAIFERFGLKM